MAPPPPLPPGFHPRRKYEKQEGSFVGQDEQVGGRGKWKVTSGEDEDRGLDCFLRMEGEDLGMVGRQGWLGVRGVGGRWEGLSLETEIVSMWSAIWSSKERGNLRTAQSLVRAGIGVREGMVAGRGQ